MKFENIPVPGRKPSPLEAYEDDEAIYDLLRQLPDELVSLHTSKIEDEAMSDQEAQEYLRRILEKRESAARISEVSDETLKQYFVGREAEIFRYIEEDLAVGDRNLLGSGGTAKVKAFRFETPEIEIPMAVKYLVTPLSDTLTAEGEHDMLVEVERLQQVEDLEKKDADKLRHVRVPHPYFHHKGGEVQCYGMELVDGMTLHDIEQGDWTEGQREAFREVLESVPLETVLEEIEIFFKNMHDFCLHGDVKAANIMIGGNGTFYVIDFGQSKLIANLEYDVDQLAMKREDEITHAKDAVRHFYQRLFR